MTESDPRTLPGFLKKSFSLPYRGGEIWFEHLDGLYRHEALALEKLRSDRAAFARPSASAIFALVLDETEVTPALIGAVADALQNAGKAFRRVCVIGANAKAERALKTRLGGGGYALACINDLEKAKEWLIPAHGA